MTKNLNLGNSLVVQWLGLCAFTAVGPGSFPGRGTNILHKLQCPPKKRKTLIYHCFALFFFKFIYLFIYCLRWVFVAACGPSLVAVSRGTLCCGALASHCSGFSCCGAWAVGTCASLVLARGLSSCGTQA